MKYSKTALGLLNAQYRSVLRKCMLINLGLFAITAVAATPANATDLNVGAGSFVVGSDPVTGTGTVSVTGLAISDTTGLQDALDGKVDDAEITDMATQTWVDGKNYTTMSAVEGKGYQTSAQVTSAVNGALTSYSTTDEMNTAITNAVNGLDASVSNTPGTDGLSLTVVQTDGKITSITGSITANTYDAYGSAGTAETNAKSYTDTQLTAYTKTADLAAVATSGAAADVSYNNATSSLTATNVQDAIDEVAATASNASNKDLNNITDAGKTVIKNLADGQISTALGSGGSIATYVTNNAVQTVAKGTANGTISVDGGADVLIYDDSALQTAIANKTLTVGGGIATIKDGTTTADVYTKNQADATFAGTAASNTFTGNNKFSGTVEMSNGLSITGGTLTAGASTLGATTVDSLTTTGAIKGATLESTGNTKSNSLEVTTTATVGQSLTVTGMTNANGGLTTSNLVLGSASLTGVDTGASAITSGSANTVATTATVLKSAENATFTPASSTALAGQTQIGGAINTLGAAVDTINTAITVTADGNYIKKVDDVKTNLGYLDTAVKDNADDIATNTAGISTINTKLGTVEDLFTTGSGNINRGDSVAEILSSVDTELDAATLNNTIQDTKLTSLATAIGGTYGTLTNAFTKSSYGSTLYTVSDSQDLTTAIGALDNALGSVDTAKAAVAGASAETNLSGVVAKLSDNLTNGSVNANFADTTVDSLKIDGTGYGVTSVGAATFASTTTDSLQIGNAAAITGTTTNTLNMNGNSLTNITDIASGSLTTDTAGKTVSIGGAGFTTTVTGDEVVTGKLGVDGAAELKSTLDVTGKTTLKSTLDVTGKTTLSSANGLGFGTETAIVKSIDDGTSAATSAGANNATTMATLASVLKSAENGAYTGDSGKNIASGSTINTAVSALDTEIGADADYGTTPNNGVVGTATVKANIAAINDKLGNIKDTAINGYNMTGTGATLVGAVSKLDSNMESVMGGIYKTDGTYDNTVLLNGTTPNGFETSATDLSDALKKYAENNQAAMGTTYSADGSFSNKYADKHSGVVAYYGLADTADLVSAISQLEENIGKGTSLGTIADRTTAAANNGVAAANTVNANIVALNETVGDLTGLNTTLGNLTNGGTANPATVVKALNNIDATLGKIHGLVASADATTTTTGAAYYGNLAVGTTVEQHIEAVDAAIGDRRDLGSKNNAVNAGTKTSVAAGIKAAGDAIGDMDFKGLSYVLEGQDLSGAVKKLDTSLARVEGNLHDLKRDFERGMASMAAMSALVPNPRSQGNTSLSVGTGAYSGHTAMAVGGFHYLTDNIMLNAGVAWGNSRDASYRLGLTWSW